MTTKRFLALYYQLFVSSTYASYVRLTFGETDQVLIDKL